MLDWTPLAAAIWRRTDQGQDFPWPKSEKARNSSVRSLALLLPQEDFGTIYPYADKTLANRQLRSCLSPYVIGGDSHIGAELARWIVSNWGGISRGADTVADWSAGLGDYSRERIDRFIADMGTKRISSWSKLLAFARPDTEAIYDARTAVALNCILSDMGYGNGFHMPTGRNKDIEPVRRAFWFRGFGQRYGYRDYIHLLEAIVATTDAPDILHVEMALFANAPKIASIFAAKGAVAEEPLDGSTYTEVSIKDVLGESYIYWVDQRLDPDFGDDSDWAIGEAIRFHRATIGTNIATQEGEQGAPDAWSCEPFTRYAGEVIHVDQTVGPPHAASAADA